MPFGIRYIAMVLRDVTREKFKGQEEEVTRSLGNLLYYRYLNPAIVSPETFDIAEGTISQTQRKNLSEVR